MLLTYICINNMYIYDIYTILYVMKLISGVIELLPPGREGKWEVYLCVQWPWAIEGYQKGKKHYGRNKAPQRRYVILLISYVEVVNTFRFLIVCQVVEYMIEIYFNVVFTNLLAPECMKTLAIAILKRFDHSLDLIYGTKAYVSYIRRYDSQCY